MRARSLLEQPSLQRIVDVSLLAILLLSLCCALASARYHNNATQSERQLQLTRAEGLLQRTLKQQQQMLSTQADLITDTENIERKIKHLLSMPTQGMRPPLLLLNHATGKPILGDTAIIPPVAPTTADVATYLVLNHTLYHTLHIALHDSNAVLTIGTPIDAAVVAQLQQLSGAYFSLQARRQQRTLLTLTAPNPTSAPRPGRESPYSHQIMLKDDPTLQLLVDIQLAQSANDHRWWQRSLIASILLMALGLMAQWWLRRRRVEAQMALETALDTMLVDISTPPASEPDCGLDTVDSTMAQAEPSPTIQLRALMRRREQAIWRQALHDPLTELPNCRSAPLCVQNLLTAGQSQPIVLICMDIQNFRLTNEAFGHHVGDRCLQQIGARLRTMISEHCLAARLKGDEFLLVVRLLRPLGQTIHQTLTTLQAPYIVEELALELQFRVGAAMFPNHGEEASSLIRCATIALDHARSEDQQIVFYEPQMEEDYLRKLKRLEDLKHALTDDDTQLQLHYQPKIATNSQNADLLRFEALIRWHHPIAGLIAPDQFIPLAEQAGLIHAVTDWVIRKVVKQISAWNLAGHPVKVAVNLSAKDLARPHLLNFISELLAEFSVDSQQLSFEITESELMRRPEEALALLHAFRNQGFELAIDDFGTGYSSLAQLKHMPITELKIDKSFVMELDQHPQDQIIVQSTVQLAHSFNIGVVAEGVENEQSLKLLQSWGCNWAQGYFISRPLPASAIPDFIQAYRNDTNFQAGCSG